MPSVSLIKCHSYHPEKVYKSVKKAVSLVGGLDGVIRPGQNVLLKVNLLSARPPEEAVTTHPELVRAMVKLVRERGAHPWVGDAASTGDLGGELQRDPFDIAGMRQVVEQEGGKIINFSSSGYHPVNVPEAEELERIYVAKPVLDADVVISVAKLKTHELTFFTGAVKNFFGCVPSADRLRAHALAKGERFARAVVDIYSMCRPTFSLIDGVTAMEGEGPSSGNPVELGVILASADCVSSDIVASKLVGFPPEEILTSLMAIKRGLGPENFQEVEVVGEKIDEVVREDFKKPSTYQGKVKRVLISFFTPIGVNFFSNFPAVNRSACSKCRICQENCSVGAIDMNPYPEFDYQKCIKCFCCHELCPSRAIYIKRHWLRRFFSLNPGEK